MRPALTISLAALAFALAGCDEIRRMTGQEPPAANSSVTANSAAGSPSLSAPAAPDGTPGKPATADPALAAEMQAAAAQLSGSLPMQVDQITRVVGIRAEGTEFVYDLTISQAIPSDQTDNVRQIMQRTNQTNMCGNPQVATFIRRGGSMNHRYVDSGGNRFETRVVSCP